MLAVDSDARGVAQALAGHATAESTATGFARVFADSTNLTAQAVFIRRGFRTLNEVCYESFEFEGNRCFVGLSDLGGIGPMEWRL
ncbi:MAG: hypothetical protein CL566_06775 [Alphaproteobacteria bacterium]|nr:hypothetical protein [Alphaproteobacteria bacterium]|tara:strand:- start:428 stop:682 length:255 start_codon:yes stop_codon:yes gene_type:complete